MTHAELFNSVMRYLWNDEDPEHYFWVRACGDKIRGTQRVNPENAFDVLIMMFGTNLSMHVRVPDVGDGDNEASIHHITFEDGSTAIIDGRYGIGGGVEII